jgi:hypothetical protein
MKLSQLKSEPVLIEITIDDKETIKQFGEALTFHTWDRQPMEVFTKLANITDKDTGMMLSIVKNLILDENAQPILDDKNMLPTSVLMKAIAKVTEILGK